MRIYWSLVCFGTVLTASLAFLQLEFLLSAAAVPLAAWVGSKLTSEHLFRLRTTEVYVTFTVIIGGGFLIGLGAFLHTPLLLGAGLFSLLTPMFGGLANDIATSYREFARECEG